MSTLEVWTRAGEHVARIRYGSEITLTYDDDVTVPISTSLPIGERYKRNAVANFLDNLLPEYKVTRAQMAAAYGVPNLVDELLVAAGDLPGNYVFTFKGTEYTPKGTAVRPETRDLSEIIHQIRVQREPAFDLRTATPPFTFTSGRDNWVTPGSPTRFALAGFQAKFAISRNDRGEIVHTNAFTPSTHIVKPEPRDIPGLEASEHAPMTLAHLVGLNVAESAIEFFGDESAYVTTRFDRDGTQYEDLMQSLGMKSGLKYNMGAILVVRHLNTLDPSGELAHEFIRQLAFNVLVGNADAHAKNYSLRITDDGSLSMSPMYDVVTSTAHPNYDQRLAMSIVGADYSAAVTRSHWRKIAVRTGLDADRVVSDVIEIADRIRDNLHVWDMLTPEKRDFAVAAILRYIAAPSRS